MAPKRDNTARTISWVMAITLIGKVMGLYRDRLLAVRYSVGMEANAFFTASRIPRVFFDAVFASAIAACFIPVFSEYLEKQGRKEAERFAGRLREVTGLPVELWDERLTSVDANRILSDAGKKRGKQRARVDAVAASLILEGYLGYIKSRKA